MFAYAYTEYSKTTPPILITYEYYELHIMR